MPAKRNDLIDLIKGLGILSVALGHCDFFGVDFIYSFHMPLFFALAGYQFSLDKAKSDVSGFIKTRFVRLLTPYAFACLCFYPLWYFGIDFGDGPGYSVPALTPLIGIFYGNGHGDWMIFNTPLWFLPCLFWSEVLFLLLNLCAGQSRIKSAIAALIAAFIGYAISSNVCLPWGFDIALVIQPFMFVAQSIKNGGLLDKIKPSTVLGSGILGTALVFTALHFNGPLDINSRVYHNMIWMYVGGMGGCAMILATAWLVRFVKPLATFFNLCGRETLVIFICHLFAFKALSGFLTIGLGLPLQETKKTAWALYGIAGLVLPLLGLYAVRYLRKAYANS